MNNSSHPDFSSDLNFQPNNTLDVFLWALSVITVTGNLLAFLVFQKCKSLRTPSNNFLKSVCVADVLAGSVSVPIFALTAHLEVWPSASSCAISIFADVLSYIAAVYSICAIAIVRCYAVSFPLRYRTHFNSTASHISILCIWLFSVLHASTILISWYVSGSRNLSCRFTAVSVGIRIYDMAVSFLLPFATLVIGEVLLVRALRKQARVLHGLTNTQDSTRGKTFENRMN